MKPISARLHWRRSPGKARLAGMLTLHRALGSDPQGTSPASPGAAAQACHLPPPGAPRGEAGRKGKAERERLLSQNTKHGERTEQDLHSHEAQSQRNQGGLTRWWCAACSSRWGLGCRGAEKRLSWPRCYFSWGRLGELKGKEKDKSKFGVEKGNAEFIPENGAGSPEHRQQLFFLNMERKI